MGIFELEMRPGKQLFPLNYNNIINNNNIKHNIKAIKLIIKETYGGRRTYINQIMFYEETAEKVQDIMSGNELSKIYKNHKKLVKSYTSVQIPYNNNKINGNKRSLSKGKIRKTINEDLSQYKTQIINQNKKNIKNLKRVSKKQFAEQDENENEFNGDNEDGNDIYNEEGKIINIEEERYNNGKSHEYYKEEVNNNEDEKEEEMINNNNRNENKKNYHKIKSKNNNNISYNNKIDYRKNNQKRKSYEITPINRTNISTKTDITDLQRNKNHKRQQLEIKLNDNLTPNKYLKRVQSYTNKNNTINSNINLSLSKNFGYVLNDKDTEKNISNIEISNISYNKNNFKSKIPSSTTYNYYVNQNRNDNQEEENDFTNDQINMNDKYQTYGERMSEPINYIKKEFPPSSFNRTNALNRNNLNNDNNNNMDLDEQNQLMDKVDNKNNSNSYIINNNIRMNQTYEDINFRNRSKYNLNENKENFSSVITNRHSNNSNLCDDQNENNIYGHNYSIETYQNSKNFSGIQLDKNIIFTNNITTNNSQRYSAITNNDNYKSNNNSNKKKQIQQKLDYLEGNIIEIKKEINLISENLSFLSSKEFIFNNFKEYVIQICEEIYNEYLINNFNNKDRNQSFISNNSNYDNNNQISQNNNINLNNNKNSGIFLDNEINKKIDEKLGNLKTNLFDKFLQPKINEIGESMKKNIEQLKSKVDTIGNNINIYKDKNIYEKTNSNSNEESLIYKSSSKIRNEKFDEINRIGEKLYNKLLEKEKKLKLLKQEKTKFLNEEIEKDN